MAKGRKTGGRDFQPGETGNPHGRPPLPSDLREARKLTKLEFERVVNQFFHMTQEQLIAKMKAPETTALEYIVGNVVGNAIKHGDPLRTEFLLKRTIGEVGTGDKPGAGEDLTSLTDQQLLDQAKEAMKLLESEAKKA